MMNNTDLKFNEEYEKVQENAEKLVVGNKYKYADLMELLELPVKKNGSAKTNQIKRVQEYINWDTKTKIFSGIIEGVESMTKKTTTSEYYDYVRVCFLYNLYESIKKNPNQSSLNLSHTKILRMCDIVSSGYVLACSPNGKKAAMELLGIGEEAFDAFMYKLRNDGISIVESTLRQMQKEKHIYFNKIATFITYVRDENNNIVREFKNGKPVRKAIYTKANADECQAIMEAESIVLSRMLPHVKPSGRMYYLKKKNLYKEYKNNVIEVLSSKYGIDVDVYYSSYDIRLNRTDTSYNTTTYLSGINYELKDKICQKMLESKDKRYLEAMKKSCFDDLEDIPSCEDTIIVMNDNVVKENKNFNKEMKDRIHNKNVKDNIHELKNEKEWMELRKEREIKSVESRHDAEINAVDKKIEELESMIIK